MNNTMLTALVALYNNQWTEDLLGFEFVHVRKSLAKREIIVLELKVQYYEDGYTESQANSEIATLLKIKPSTLSRLLYDIKHVYRHGLPRRVDNKLHPEIFRAKKRKREGGLYGHFGSNSQNT